MGSGASGASAGMDTVLGVASAKEVKEVYESMTLESREKLVNSVWPEGVIRARPNDLLGFAGSAMLEDCLRFDPSVRDDVAVSIWLGLSPPPTSAVFHTLQTCFPGAVTGKVVLERTCALVRPYGLDPDNTIYGQSICPDEINNEAGDLATLMQDHWGECFPMGGIGGAPYVGKTGFGAFSHHVPEDGHVLILFGPHIAISKAGVLGKYHRVGQSKESGACGAVLAAYAACCSNMVRVETDRHDMQQCWLEKKIEASLDNIRSAEEPLAELMQVAYMAVQDKLLACVNTGFGKGKLVLVGGIQINMPEPYADHFQPLCFSMYSEGESTIDLLPMFHSSRGVSRKTLTKIEMAKCKIPNAPVYNPSMVPSFEHVLDEVYGRLEMTPMPGSDCWNSVDANFPGALPGHAILHRSAYILTRLGLQPDNTIFGCSICPDEINNEKGDLATDMKDYWGASFPMGGIGGAPFVGKTGFMAFSHHVPDDGHVFILFGPHIAVSDAGELGKYLRLGQRNHSGACGAVLAAYGSCCNGEVDIGIENGYKWDPLDLQQSWLRDKIARRIDAIRADPEPLAKLINVAFEAVKEKLLAIVNHNFGNGKLVLLGGIQINMPSPFRDQFQPLFFQASSRETGPQDLLSELCPGNHC